MKTIERLRELEKSATTPRPWKPEEVGEAFRWFRKMGDHNTFTTQDGELAAAAVNAIPALLAVVEAADRYVSDWDAQVSDPKAACYECEDPEHIATIRAALRSLEGEAQ